MSNTKITVKQLKERMKLILLREYTDEYPDDYCLINTDYNVTDTEDNPLIKNKYIHTPPNILVFEDEFHEDKGVNFIPFVKGDTEIEVTNLWGTTDLIEASRGSNLTVKKIKGYTTQLGCNFKVRDEEFCPCIDTEEIVHISEMSKRCERCHDEIHQRNLTI